MLVNNLLVPFFSLSIRMTSSWQDLVSIAFIVFSSWLWVISVKFLSFVVSISFGWYAGMLVNSSLILSILFKKKSAESSVVDYQWYLLVVGFCFCSPICFLLPWIVVWNLCWSLLLLLPGGVFCCILAFYCVCFIPWWMLSSVDLLYMQCVLFLSFWWSFFVQVVDLYTMACFVS